MADPKHPFGLKGDKRRKERKGGAAAAPGAAAGAAPSGIGFDSGAEALATLGRAAPVGSPQAGLWEAVVSSLSKATGMGALAAGKTAVVALVVTASSLAAGVSLYIGNSTPSQGPSLGRRVFVDATADETPALTPRHAARSDDEAPQTGGSLDYLAQGNTPAPEAPAAPERAVDAPAAAPEVKTAEAPNHDAPTAAPPPHQADPGPKPVLAKRAMPQTRGETGGGAKLTPMDTLSTKVGAGFQDVYRPQRTGSFDASKQTRPNYGAMKKSITPKSGNNAMAQARFTNRLSQSGARMSAGSGSAHTASLPFDGGNHVAPALGNTKAGGAAIGGSGLASSANGLLDSKSVEPPPAPESKKNENKTPYQGLMMAAMAALMLGTVLLMLAGKMSGEAKKCTGPDCAAKLQAAQMMAAAAMAAGGAAAGMGGMLAGQYGQMAQGLPFIMGGGMIAVQAGMVLAKDDKAGDEANQATDSGLGQLANAASPLAQGMGNNNDQGAKDSKPSKPKPTGKSYTDNPFRGNINGP